MNKYNLMKSLLSNSKLKEEFWNNQDVSMIKNSTNLLQSSNAKLKQLHILFNDDVITPQQIQKQIDSLL